VGKKNIQRAKIKYNHETPTRPTDLSYNPTDLSKTKTKNKIQIKQYNTLTHVSGKTQLYQT
jgi:hypothetical protein